MLIEEYGVTEPDENGEVWEAGIFKSKRLKRLNCESTPQRDIWKAVHKKDTNAVERLLKDNASSHIFTCINVRDKEQDFVLPYLGTRLQVQCEFEFNEQIEILRSVVMTAAGLGLYDILKLIITAHPSSINTFNNVCFYKIICLINLHYNNLFLFYVVSDNTAHESCYT